MKTTEIIKKAYEAYPEMLVPEHPYCPDNLHDYNSQQREGYIKALQELSGKSQKIWIARDSREDPMFGLGLCAHFEKPKREADCWSADTILFHISWEKYPEVTWEGEPKEIELIFLD